MNEKRGQEWGIMALLFAAALGIRLLLNDSHPPGLWYDEAINGLDALEMLRDRAPRIFFTTDNHPREPFFMYLLAGLYLFFKPTVFILRGASGLMGALTVPVVYRLARAGGWDRRAALLSALSLLFMRWHIHHSRLAFRGILIPLWYSLSLLLLFRAAEGRKWRIWALAGAVTGLGFYTHLTFRLAPFLLLAAAWRLWSSGSIRMKRDRRGLAAFAAALGVVFLPLGIDYIIHPFHFSGRLQEVSLFEAGLLPGLLEIAKNTGRALLLFSFRGDQNPFLNIPGAPALTPVGTLFFMCGLAAALLRARRNVLCFCLFPWTGLILLTTILSTEAPHFGRTLGVTAPIALLAGLGASEAYEWTRDFLRRRKALLLIGGLFCLMCAWDLSLYFGRYRGDIRLWRRSNAAWADIIRATADLEGEGVLVYLPGDIFHHPTARYLLLTQPSDHIRPTRFPECLIRNGEDVRIRGHVILATIYNGFLPVFAREFPGGSVIRHFREPEGAAHAWFYRIAAKDLLERKKAEEYVERYSPAENW